MKRYEAYKDSGVEWIGEIPEQWEFKKLKYVAKKVQTGSTPPSEEEQYFKDEVDWFTPSDFNEGLTLKNSKRKISTSAIDNGIVKLFPENSVLLVGIGGTLGKVGYIEKPAASNQQINSISFGDRATAIFYAYFFHINQKNIVSLTNAATLPILNQNQTKDIDLPVPQANEMSNICNYLDHKISQLDSLINKKEKLIELLHEERTAIINHAVTKGLNPNSHMRDSGIEWLGEIPEHWEVKKLKYVANINPSKHTYEFEKSSERPVVFLPMEKVSEDGVINQELMRKISDVSSGFTYFEKNDVIVAKITPCFENGKGALLKDLITDFGFGSTEFHTIRATNIILKEFIYFLTKSERFMTIGEAFMTGSAGQKRVPTSFIENFTTGIPPIVEQSEIVNYIEIQNNKVDLIIAKSQQEIDLLKEYKTALISEVVTGKVDVRNEILN